MSSSALATMRHKLEQARARASSIREDVEAQTETVVGVGVGILSAGAYGMLDEKYGEDAIFGTSVPLVGGIILTGAAIGGYGGSARTAMLEAGKAGLYVESYKAGSRMYRDWAEEDETPSGS